MKKYLILFTLFLSTCHLAPAYSQERFIGNLPHRPVIESHSPNEIYEYGFLYIYNTSQTPFGISNLSVLHTVSSTVGDFTYDVPNEYTLEPFSMEIEENSDAIMKIVPVLEM